MRALALPAVLVLAACNIEPPPPSIGYFDADRVTVSTAMDRGEQAGAAEAEARRACATYDKRPELVQTVCLDNACDFRNYKFACVEPE